jgi:hypothetical protein
VMGPADAVYPNLHQKRDDVSFLHYENHSDPVG